MIAIDAMLSSRINPPEYHLQDYAEALDALIECAAACTLCADACLGETGKVEQLRGCITMNLDCADVCATTVRLLSRQTQPPNQLIHAQMHACVVACQLCADQCAMHPMHKHCKICAEICHICRAEICHICQEHCNFLLGTITSAGIAEEKSSI